MSDNRYTDGTRPDSAQPDQLRPDGKRPDDLQPDSPQPGGEWTGIAATREEYRAAVADGAREAEPGPAGFGDGEQYDVLAPGPRLAQLAADAAGSAMGCAGLDDDELIGVLCAWQRLASWAQAGTAAAITTLATRRAEAAAARGDTKDLDTHVRDEIAAALTMTGLSAMRLLDTSAAITRRLPGIHQALAAGKIDWPRARVFADELSVLDDDDLAREITERRLRSAPINTTGQLRARLQRDVLDADPAAAEARRERGRRQTRLEVWHEDSGNAALAGRELPAARAIALHKQITATAEWLKDHGIIGSINELRAEVYLTLLSGRDPATLLGPDSVGSNTRSTDTPASDTASSDPNAADIEPGGQDPATSSGAQPGPASARSGRAGQPQLAGQINLTFPLSAWARLSDASGEVAGYGPADTGTCRDLASWTDVLTRLCLTLTDQHGNPVAHACTSGPAPPPGQPAIRWAKGLRDKLQYLESGTCGHSRQSAGYRPPDGLAHLIKIRQRTCSFPGCRRAARFCDLDHSLAYDKGGITCECNLSPLCRRHHRAKQTFGWHLVQTEPGHMTWQLPHNRSYKTTGEPYPA